MVLFMVCSVVMFFCRVVAFETMFPDMLGYCLGCI